MNLFVLLPGGHGIERLASSAVVFCIAKLAVRLRCDERIKKSPKTGETRLRAESALPPD